MRLVGTIAAVALVSGPALGIECPVSHAIYEQPGRQVAMHFSQVPRDGAPNQIAAFDIHIEGVSAKLHGDVYIPNGFGQPHGFVGEDCTGAEGEQCEFWDGIVYALGADGIEELPWSFDTPAIQQMAPRQVLLPGFASNVWYSMLRGDAFEGARTVLDTFTLAACAK